MDAASLLCGLKRGKHIDLKPVNVLPEGPITSVSHDNRGYEMDAWLRLKKIKIGKPQSRS
jgi:hypothetical protein